MDKIKLLVFDIDGTLLPRGENDLPASCKEALSLVKKKGIEVLIATGRAFYFIPECIKAQVDPDYYVTINGHCLLDRNQNIIERYDIDAPTLLHLKELCRKYDIGMGVKFKDAVVCYHNYEQFWQGYLKKKDVGSLLINNETSCDYHLNHDQAMGIFLIGDEENITQYIAPLFTDLSFTFAYKNGFDVFHKDVNKTKTIASVLQLNQMTWANVMSFGDGENDIEMLREAAVGVALGNAEDCVKECADFVTTSIHNDGIFNALKHFKII